jgi:hypothetical protein
VLTALDRFHLTGVLPFVQTFLLWEIAFKADLPNLFELSLGNAPALHIFPQGKKLSGWARVV